MLYPSILTNNLVYYIYIYINDFFNFDKYLFKIDKFLKKHLYKQVV